jgi:large subunit ribosomal protein L44e
MKITPKIRTHCPFCNKHTVHKVKEYKKGKTREMAKGQLRHKKKIKGYGSKIAGEKHVYKQAKRVKLILTCEECKKKHEMVRGGRTKKRIEIKEKE